MPYTLAALGLAATTLLVLWTAMRWPHPRTDLTVGLTGGTAVAIWSVFNGTHPGPAIGSMPFTLADIASLPALLVASLLMGRTVLLRSHPHPGTHPTAAPPTPTLPLPPLPP